MSRSCTRRLEPKTVQAAVQRGGLEPNLHTRLEPKLYKPLYNRTRPAKGSGDDLFSGRGPVPREPPAQAAAQAQASEFDGGGHLDQARRKRGREPMFVHGGAGVGGPTGCVPNDRESDDCGLLAAAR